MWIDPPVFVEDGLPLQARQLNTLSDNAAWLYNQVRRMVPAMPVYRVPWNPDFQYEEQVQAEYRIRHVGRYLKARVYGTSDGWIPTGATDRPWWKIYYDGRLIVTGEWPRDETSRRMSVDHTIDLQAVLPGLVVGTRYQISVEHGDPAEPPWGGEFELTYLYETEMVE